MTRRRLLWTVLILGVCAAAAWYRLGPRRTPPGQAPLLTLNASAVETLRADFNRDADAVRIIVLLSPT
jgi:hypothetical protein